MTEPFNGSRSLPAPRRSINQCGHDLLAGVALGKSSALLLLTAEIAQIRLIDSAGVKLNADAMAATGQAPALHGSDSRLRFRPQGRRQHGLYLRNAVPDCHPRLWCSRQH